MPELQYDLVFEASVEVFMWQDDGVEYDDLRWDIYITAWWDRERSHIRLITFRYRIMFYKIT